MAKAENSRTMPMKKQQSMLGNNMSFAGSEAYKQLRTNLMFTLPMKEDREGRIIGVTGACAGDGKSTVAINLANSIAQAGFKVLLIEGDLRLPVMSKRLEVNAAPGLSNLLIGDAKATETIQKTDGITSFYCITAGDIPPNPSELLSSQRMKQCLRAFSKTFDYIVLDLPPVNVVTDAAAVAQDVDGYVMVVRQNVTTIHAVDEAMEKLKLVDAKVLGFILNDVKLSKRYYRSSYGSAYYAK